MQGAANVDASFRGTANSPPLSPVILDYMYGVAAYTQSLGNGAEGWDGRDILQIVYKGVQRSDD